MTKKEKVIVSSAEKKKTRKQTVFGAENGLILQKVLDWPAPCCI